MIGHDQVDGVRSESAPDRGVHAVSFGEMCDREGIYVQRGMYFRARPGHSLFLLAARNDGGYADAFAADGDLIVYQGHNAPRSKTNPWPQLVDQPAETRTGALTQNGRFQQAAENYKAGRAPAEPVQIYRKLRGGVWLNLGMFRLVDAWTESDGRRRVFKFKLRRVAFAGKRTDAGGDPRALPAWVRARVWNRDGGRCVVCGATEDLHFDHIIPVVRGGGVSPKNIQLLCARHNIRKSDSI